MPLPPPPGVFRGGGGSAIRRRSVGGWSVGVGPGQTGSNDRLRGRHGAADRRADPDGDHLDSALARIDQWAQGGQRAAMGSGRTPKGAVLMRRLRGGAVAFIRRRTVSCGHETSAGGAACVLVVAGCGSQTRTVTVTTPQTTSTSSPASVPTTTAPLRATTSTSTSTGSSVPSWIQAAKKGCPAGEVLLKTLSNGARAPYGNDGCVYSDAWQCPPEPTCDPANAPGQGRAVRRKLLRTLSRSSSVWATNDGSLCCPHPGMTAVKGHCAPPPVDCGTINGWTAAYDSSANNGQGGCVYTYATGYKIVAPPGTYMYSFQNFLSDVGGVAGEHCTLFVWSNGSTRSSQTVCGS